MFIDYKAGYIYFPSDYIKHIRDASKWEIFPFGGRIRKHAQEFCFPSVTFIH